MQVTGAVVKWVDFSGKGANRRLISRPIDLRRDNLVCDVAGGGPPLQYAFHNVPYFHQRHVNDCGDACGNAILAFYGKTENMKSLATNARGIFERLSESRLIAWMREAGLNRTGVPLPRKEEGWSAERLTVALAGCGPMICGGVEPGEAVGHFVVLIGVSEDNVLLHDPWTGPRKTKSIDEFNAFLAWGDKDCMLAFAPIKDGVP